MLVLYDNDTLELESRTIFLISMEQITQGNRNNFVKIPIFSKQIIIKQSHIYDNLFFILLVFLNFNPLSRSVAGNKFQFKWSALLQRLRIKNGGNLVWDLFWCYYTWVPQPDNLPGGRTPIQKRLGWSSENSNETPKGDQCGCSSSLNWPLRQISVWSVAGHFL